MTGSPASIVVFGASGFIGGNLVRRLVTRGAAVYGVTRTGAPVPGCEQTLSMARHAELPALAPDTVVINLAAHPYDAGQFAVGQSEILAQNVGIATAVYHFCATRGIREVRLASSCAVYPSDQQPADDSIALNLNGWPNSREAAYAWSKRWAEICAEIYRQQYGIHTLTFRLTNPYGPHDSTDLERAHVVPALIMRTLADGPTLELRGNPDAERDFVYVDDVVEVFTRSLPRRGEHGAYNLAFGATTSIAEVARQILAAAGSSKRLVLKSSPGGVAVRGALGSKLRSDFCVAPFTPLEVGLERTIAWYRNVLGC